MKKIKNWKIKYLLLILVFGFLFFGAGVVLAQDTFGLQPIQDASGLGGGNIRLTITNIIRITLGLLGIVALAIVLYGGFIYMTSNGEEDKIATAKKILINGVIGLAIILSAFTITQFIFQKLSEATGTGYVDLAGVDPGTCDLSDPLYVAADCNKLCSANPLLSLCEEQHFYVKSITPSTPLATDATKMNNIVARVVFSRKLADGIDLAKSLEIKNLDTGEIVPVIIEIFGDKTVLEAYMADSTEMITNDSGKGYEIKVNPGLTDDVNGVLETDINGKNYPLAATFRVDATAFTDAVKPTMGSINILNSNNQATNLLYIGDTFSVSTLIRDRSNGISYGGNAMAYVQITDVAFPETKLLGYFGGPEAKIGSSVDYLSLYNGIVSQNVFQPLHTYQVGVTGFDIDSNNSSASTQFTVFGKSCNNNIKDDDETGVDTGGSCGSIGACSLTSPCANGYLCVEGQCKAQPIIKEVVPMNGAAGNWITIYGSNFGTAAGKIEFASKNANGTYRPWVLANVISCQGQASWHDDWVVAEVPSASYLDSAVEIGPAKGSVRMPTNPALDISGQLTLEAWVKTADTGGYKIIISKKGSYFLSLNKLRPAVYLTGTKNPGWHMMSASIPPNVWTHLAIAYDGGKVNFFINGQKQSYVGSTSGNIISTPGESLWIGDRIDFSNSWLNGQIDQVAVYNSALSDSAILNHYKAKNSNLEYENAVAVDKPVGFWQLGETNGTVAYDSSLNKINGSFVGAVKLGVEAVFGNTLSVLKGGNQIRLTSGDDPTLSDTTVDDFGPKPLPPFGSELEKNNYLATTDPGLFLVNDIKRPGLCRVAVSEQKTFQVGDVSYVANVGDLAAPPGTPLVAIGTGFGASQNTSNIKFSVRDAKGALLPGFNGEVTSTGWSDNQIFTSVPLNLVGDTAVYATVQNEQSNSVKFTVISDKDFKVLPTISAIDPVSTTPKSYITITGTGFGDYVGQIFVADSVAHVLGCGSDSQDSSCQPLIVSLPSQCGNTWTDTQIIAQVPENAVSGKFYLILQRGDAARLKSNGADKFEIKSGNPRPGICLLDPSQGPAPLPVGTAGLSLYGQNFSDAPLVYFQSKKTKLDELNTWLVSADTDLINKGNNKIQTKIPLDLVSNDGSSMVTGFIKVKAQGEVSNGVKYTVEDCRKTVGEPEGLHCCTEGADAGLWKPDMFTCDGETREAGFVWRFASGVISDNPRVVEECNEAEYSKNGVQMAYPSPVPSEKWQKGKNACINSSIVVRFNLPMKPGTLDNNNVKVYRCGETNGKIDCGNMVANEVTDLNLKIETGANDETVLIIKDNTKGDLAKNTWYHVELTDKIVSYETRFVLGQETYLEQPLQKTKPCGQNPAGLETAYCFDFKTSELTCKLAAASINPPNYSVNYLGKLFNPQFPPAANADPFTVSNPLYYFVWGRGDQECSVLNVDKMGWQWDADPGVADAINKKAQAFVAPSAEVGKVYTDSRATVDAKQNTYPDRTLVKAQTTVAQSAVGNIGGTDVLALAGKDKGYQQDGSSENKVQIDSASTESTEDDIINLGLESFTLEVKYKLDGLSDNNSELIGKKDAYSLMYYAGDGKNKGLCFQAPLLNSTNSICVHDSDTQKPPVVGDTYHYIYVYDKDTKKIKLFGDGKLIGEKFFGDIPQNVDPMFFVGSVSGADTVPATYDTVRIFPGKLSDATIIDILNNNTVASLITAVSDLMIDLGDPQVTYYEPDCIESCINPSIRVKFSRQMDRSTYDGNYEIYQCADSNCAVSDLENGLFNVDHSSSDQNNLVLTLSGSSVLAANTYYKVVLTDDITAIGGIIPAVGEGQPTIVPGKHLKPFAWYFKTQNNSTPCSANYLRLSPDKITASTLGEKSEISATPYTSPNSCSKYGQALDKWQFGYNWAVLDPMVATISNFNSAYGWKSFCTESCLPVGSDIKRDISDSFSVCGNGKKEKGEDCDIGDADEIAGVSCSLNCLWPGNNQKVATDKPAEEVDKCGNGVAETAVGEQCDPGASLTTNNTITTDIYCSDVCKWKGSNPPASGEKSSQAEANKPGAQKPSVCGDGEVGKGETCEIGDKGCSINCLNKGTITSANWCAMTATAAQKNSTQCVGAVSVCGNGIIENNEECEVGAKGATVDTCDASCLVKDVCDFPLLKQCEKGTEGCNSDCTLAGSSPLYGVGSLCGDGIVGAGEFGTCENTPPQLDSVPGDNPVQLITARGAKVTTENIQTTTIRSALFDKPDVSGSSEYALQCGYKEFDAPVMVVANGQNHPVYNDCPENSAGGYNNALGVGKNSCCLPRSKRVAEYPVDGAGFFGQPGVCRNTFISVEIPTDIKPDSITKNIRLAHGYTDPAHICAPGTENLTAVINEMLGDTTLQVEGIGWLQKLWNGIKHFFAGLFGAEANASKMEAKDIRDLNNGKLISVWCGAEVSFITDVQTGKEGTVIATTTIAVYLNNPLEKEDVYAVILKGGKTGITDQNGVGIKSPDYTLSPNDVWFFQTGKDICKLKSVKVEPSGYLFNQPFATSSFFARTESVQGQQIVSTPAYEWAWHWGPINSIFDIPVVGTPANKTTAMIGAKNVEGSLTGVVQAVVIKDISTEGENHLGKSFNALFDLVAMFCANPWPGFNADGSWGPYKDNKYNFSLSYCADGGSSMTQADDLPYLKEPLYFLPTADALVKKCALENKTCGADADCDPTLYKSADGVAFSVAAGSGLCWDKAKNASFNNLSCAEINDCFIGKELSLTSQYDEIIADNALVYAVSATNEENKIEIYDVSDINNIKLIGSYQNQAGVIKDLQIQNNYGYFVSPSNGGLQVINLANPTQPSSQLASVANVGSPVTNLAVVGDKAYVVAAGLSDGKPTVYALDISNPAQPTVISSLTIPTASDDEIVSAIEARDGKLVIGTYKGRVYVVETMETGSLQMIETIILPSGTINSTVSDIEIFDNHAILASKGFKAGISIINLAAAPLTAVPFGDYDGAANLGRTANTLFISNGVKVDLLQFNGDSIPKISKSYLVPAGAVSPSGNYLFYLIDQINNKKLGVINLQSDPLALECRTQFDPSWKNSCQAAFQFVTPEILSGDTIKRLVFFNDVNEDAVGLQIFSNLENKSIDEWYTGHGFDLAGMQKTTIAGYEALSDGHNFYVNGLNFAPVAGGKGIVYKNIYLFSVNPSAQDETIAVVEQIMKSLKFNINLTDHNQCLVEDTPATINTVRENSNNITGNNKCTNDFDCRNELGASLAGTNGVCSNVKTKFFRDLLARLPAIETAQTKIYTYLNNNKNLPSFKGDLKGGSYIPGYTVSKWPSWGVLGGLVGGLPLDPINRWTKCDADDQQTCWKAASSIYSCPAFKSVYEYEFVPANKDFILHAPLEFFNLSDDIAIQYIDEARFSLAPWCAGSSISPFDESCGNGIIGPNEQCDPAGQVGYSKTGDTPTQAGTCQLEPNKVCSEDSECGYYKLDPYVVSPGAMVCGLEDNGIKKVVIGVGDTAASPVKNQYFACATDDDCKSAATYGAGLQLTTDIYSPPLPELFPVADFIAANQASLACKTLDAEVLAGYKHQLCQNAIAGLEDQTCAGSNFAQKTCLASCQWDYGICKSKNICDNGIVEAGEVCDDGALNGSYGHCNDSCSGLFDSYCGDGQKDPSKPSKEFCDWSATPWDAYSATYKYYGLKKENSCAWDCKGVGIYCGDGITNGPEECDDANTNENDDCNKLCEQSKFCAFGNETNKCLSDADCSQAKMYGGEVVDVLAHQNVCLKDFKLLFSIPDPASPNFLSAVQCNTTDDCNNGDIYKTQAFDKGLKLYQYGEPNSGYSNLLELQGSLGGDKFKCLPVSNTQGTLSVPNSCVLLSELCGNGIKGSTEQCDDGNDANNDGCSAECKIEIMKTDKLTKIKGCGSGAVDVYPEDPTKNEVCDLGAQNGIKCVPEYGKSCNYCAGDCKKVLTVDAKEFCGDGWVNGPEKCDKKDGKVFGSAAVLTCLTDKNACVTNCAMVQAYQPCVDLCNQTYSECTNILSCPDKGAYQCSANCLVLENKCVACKDGVGKPVPYARYINPMLSADGGGYGKAISIFDYTFFKITNGVWYHFNQIPNGEIDYNNLGQITLNKGAWPLIFQNNSKAGIETDQLCKDEYKLAFNVEKIKTEKTPTAAELVSGKYFDIFKYGVNGESKEVFNDLIYSPAVPKNVFRVVIRWGEAENSKNGTFVGSLYNDNLAAAWQQNPAVDETSEDAVFDYIDYAVFDVEVKDDTGKVVGSKNNLCDGLITKKYDNVDYHWPFINSNNDTSVCKSTFNAVGYNSIYVHPIISIGGTSVQSFTVDLNNHNGDFAFLVSSINNLLSTFKDIDDSELAVEVYGFHPGQSPLYSVYAPIATFRIKDIVDENFNPLAKYWHVFNFRKNSAGDYEVKKIPVTDAGGNYVDDLGVSLGEYDNGWLNTNICQVLNQIPDVPSANKCPL